MVQLFFVFFTCSTFTVQFVTYCSTQQFLVVIHYLNGIAGDSLQKILHSGVRFVTHVLFPEVSIDDLVKSCGMKLYICRP